MNRKPAYALALGILITVAPAIPTAIKHVDTAVVNYEPQVVAGGTRILEVANNGQPGVVVGYIIKSGAQYDGYADTSPEPPSAPLIEPGILVTKEPTLAAAENVLIEYIEAH